VVRSAIPAAIHAACVGVIVLVGSAHAQSADGRSTVSEVPLPGGVRAALHAIGDETAPDRALFLIEFIRRTYDSPFGPRQDRREMILQSLLARIEDASATTGRSETLPLPLSPRIWIDSVFGGRATPETLVSAILRSRGAALLYHGLLSLDDDTREWITGQPALLAELASGSAAAFVAAAPGLRVSAARLHVPGGSLAQPAWEALVGRAADPPADFLRALIDADDGRLAYFFGAVSQLSQPQIRTALHLDAADAASRLDSARRLFAVFRQLVAGRAMDRRAFTRPALDPALLVAELNVDDQGVPVVPGTRGLWNAVFTEADEGTTRTSDARFRSTADWNVPADFPWLCERVFAGDAPDDHRRRYVMVLFASRRLGLMPTGSAQDAIDAIRAAGAYPALTMALERAGVTSLAVIAAAARRATTLAGIDDERPAFRALGQFQGALALLTRAGARGSLAPADASALVSSLSAIDVGEGHGYDGRLVRWLSTLIRGENGGAGTTRSTSLPHTSGTTDDVLDSVEGRLEQEVLRFLAGPAAADPPVIEWEGTNYRLDLMRAEALRLTNALGHPAPAWVSASEAVLLVADALGRAGLSADDLRPQADALARVVQVERVDGQGVPERFLEQAHEATAALERAAASGNAKAAARLAPALRRLADDMLARGLMELAYASALGRPQGVSISASEAADRHDFGLQPSARRTAPWRFPRAGADGLRRWGVRGALLGLDVSLSDFSLLRVSSKPPARRPSLGDAERRSFIDAVALVQPAFLTENDRDTILGAMRQGRARLHAAADPREAARIADDAGLSPARRALLAWAVAHDRERAGVFLSPSELLWLGLGNDGAGALHAWGAPAVSRMGCLCLQMVVRRPWEGFAGRESRGMIASAFPDLNLRLAELLADLRMPAALLGPVLAAATVDFVDSAISRDFDDRRGLVEFVQSLRTERVEQYLALLTTDGPLVPLEEAPAAGEARTDARSQERKAP
jgi:hypothetical protein